MIRQWLDIHIYIYILFPTVKAGGLKDVEGNQCIFSWNRPCHFDGPGPLIVAWAFRGILDGLMSAKPAFMLRQTQQSCNAVLFSISKKNQCQWWLYVAIGIDD